MNTRGLLNILLLIIVVVLGAVMYFQPGLEPDQKTQKLTNLLPEQIDHIVITRKDNERIELNKKKEKWFITSPIEVAANAYRIEPLLQLVQATSQAQFERGSLELDKYNLAEPSVSVRFNDVEIAFGDSEPLSKRRYVLSGNEIHLISDIYYYRLLTDVAGFVSTALLPDNTQIAKMDLPDFQLAYQDDGHWSVAPDGDRSADAINTLLDMWRHAQAMEVSPYVAGQTLGSIHVHYKDGSVLKFEILDNESEFILGRNDIGMQYHFTLEQGQQLTLLPSNEDMMNAGEAAEIIEP